MRFNWQEVGHLKMSEHYGYMPKGEDIKVTGNIDPLKKEVHFQEKLLELSCSYGFHSKKLTHLFYFSMWAKLLHVIMYTFRKKPLS